MLQSILILRRPRARGAWFLTVALLIACGGDDDGAADTGTETAAEDETGEDGSNSSFEPVLLDCPTPGALPFSTQTTELESSEAAAVVQDHPRFKDEASDILGNRGGPVAFTRMALSESPGSRFDHQGRKARTGLDEGLAATPITGEHVSLWQYDGTDWSEVARTRTDDDGYYAFDGLDPGGNAFQPIYSILEGEGSCTPHYAFLLDPMTQVVLTDIDGTLTLNDEEFLTQIEDGSHVPAQMGSAARMLNLWADKGYYVVYMSARSHVFRSETRIWLDDHGFPPGPLITSNAFVFGASAQSYKATWASRLLDDFGWDIVAAYGDATSDIGAYAEAGISKEITFIAGEHAGLDGTQPIEGDDYADHIAEFVEPHRDATH